MTVSANSRRREYQGNGVATVFNGPMAFARSHVKAYLLADGVLTPVPPPVYTVERLGNEGGTRITMNTAPAVNQRLILLRLMPYTQDVDVTNQGAFHAETIEKGFDSLEMQIQQIYDDTLQLIFDEATGMFVWDAKGNRIIRVGDAIADQDAMNLRSSLTLIEQINNGGGTTGITPKFWQWTGNGVDTDFQIAGADVLDPLFYDTAQEKTASAGDYLVAKPGDFQILAGVDGAPPVIRFAVAPGNGVRGFTTLRGYARPWIGPSPITTVAPTIITNITGDTLITSALHNSLIVINSASLVTLTIRANTGAASDWKQGQFFSVLQLGAGKVRFAIEGTGQVLAPVDFSNEARGIGSVISATCYAPDSGAWVSSGDLLRNVQSPDIQCIRLEDRSVFIGTNIAAGTGKASIQMPYGMKLKAVASGGVYATLAVAQAAGVVLTVDVNRNGTSIFTTALTFDNAEKTTRTAATPAVYAAGGDVLSEGDEITIDVDQVGTALAKGLSVYLVGERI